MLVYCTLQSIINSKKEILVTFISSPILFVATTTVKLLIRLHPHMVFFFEKKYTQSILWGSNFISSKYI